MRSINQLSLSRKRFLFAVHRTRFFIKGNSNFPSTRIVEFAPSERHFTIGSGRALKFDAWRAAAFTFPYKTRIAQFPAEARIISVSNKIQRQTLAGNARFLLIPRRRHPPPFRSFFAFSFLLQIQFSVASLHHTPLLFSSTLPLAALLVPHSSASETLREITLNIYFRDDCSRRHDGINIIM